MTATTQPADTHEATSGSSSPTRDIALIAAFAALISASAYVGAIPIGSAGVPITLQTLTVMLAGCVLGPLRGFAAVVLYLALGAVGLPVFAEHSSGIGVFTGISGGYLMSFPLAALLGGFLVKYVARERRTRATRRLRLLARRVGAGDPHDGHRGDEALRRRLAGARPRTWDMPFWIGDLVKTSLVAMIAAEVHRAFPQLLQRR